MSTTPTLCGRLGDSNMTVQDDPRTLPVLAKLLRDLQLGGHNHTPLQDTSDIPALEPSIRKVHEGFSALYENLPNELPEDQDEAPIEPSEIMVENPDGHKIKVYVFRPKSFGNEPLPAICYIHGGGMTVLDTANKCHFRWCKSLALQGTAVFAIDFRNAWGSNGEHRPFPTGLNDCAAAVRYVAAHKAELGISRVVVQGESGGGNLTLATALKANQEGWIDAIDGVYACVPVTDREARGRSREEKLQAFPSLVECEGYLLNLSGMVEQAAWYTPNESDQKSPLAWPDRATEKDLQGLPPHIISVDELDPLRDEGIAYFRKLAAAGVQATAEVNLGITHGASLIFRQALPEVHRKAIRQIVAFAKRL
ncbi:Brefeldin A esterase [Lecanosticta acicola]|uniref:Brefeldin A esterase n=1 Tax=Lecanosticta acicola TaxID=111012 RepID=A0AAI8YW71_9PEZI|nr:Brefeldin A esterase [Lecanosticta acicola]